MNAQKRLYMPDSPRISNARSPSTGTSRVQKKYADDQNLDVIGTYIDRALSARSDNRPDFLRMIADSSKGLFQYVVVYQLGRKD